MTSRTCRRLPRHLTTLLASLALFVATTPDSAIAQAGQPKLAAGDTRAILQELDRYIPKALADWNGAGVAVGIVKDDSLIYAKGFGVREVGKPEPVDDRTLFAIGSNTKFFTAVMAGMLADEGKLALDDKITKHLPWFQLYDPWVTREITLRDAMSHRSGLGNRGDVLWYGTNRSRDEVIRQIRYLVPNSSFRSEFGYQNTMFLTAGQVLAAATGKSWDDLVRERIFGPLGMTSSNTSVKQLAGQVNVATPHNLGAGETRPRVIPYLDIDNVAPAGSINSNVQDMARWMRFILAGGSVNGQALLKPATLAEITSAHTVATRIVADTAVPSTHYSLYGLGIVLTDMYGTKVLWHTGGIDGMLSYVAMVPERRLGVVVLTNVTGHNTLYGALGKRILESLLGGRTRDLSATALAAMVKAEQDAADATRKRWDSRPQGTSPSRPLPEYAGTYHSEMYGDLAVALEDGKLALHYPRVMNYVLTHFAYDGFLGVPSAANALTTDATNVRFALDADGKLASVEVEGVDTFARVK